MATIRAADVMPMRTLLCWLFTGLLLLLPFQPAQAATTSTAADRAATKKELQRYTVAIGTLAFDASGELRATEQLEFRLLRVCPNGTIVQPPKPCPK